jgi:CDP-4-dehydro-6-deoxyglucose reductase
LSDFELRIEPQARSVRVRAGQSLLDAALAAGLNLPHSCKSGHCTSCRARLLAGRVEYPRGRPAGLTAEEAGAGRVLLCQARAASDVVVEVRRIAPAGSVEIRRLPCRIERRTLLAPDVLQLFLRLPAVEPLPFRAGQYLDVLLEDGARRSFSIASPPHDAAPLELHVRRAPGGGFTSRLFEAMPAGSLLRIEGPIGQFAWPGDGSPLLLIAGGTGFAPIKSMLRHAFEVENATRPIAFYWGVRRRVDAYEAALLRDWTARHAHFDATIVLSDDDAGDEGASCVEAAGRLRWRRGWVHEVAAAELGAQLPRRDVLVAGPPQLVEAVRRDYPPLGVDDARIRFDSFDYAPR